MSLPQNILRSTIRSLPIPHCLHFNLHIQQPQVLIYLRSFSAQYTQRSVLVRAQRSAVAERPGVVAAPTSFEQLGLGPELLAFLDEHSLHTPTEIQTAAISEVLRGGDVLLASHTGSGKTLAYLLPLVKLLKDAERQGAEQARPRRPRALVLGPTRELTDQILGVAKSIAHHAKFRSACVNGGGAPGQQAEALAQPLDILVGTPQKMVQHAEKGNLFWGDVSTVILDEADTMFDAGFGPEVRAVLGPLRSKPNPARVVLVVATMSQAVKKLLAREFPELRRVETSSLHRGVAGARHSFLPAPPNSNKLDVLAQVVTGEAGRGKKVMVFCNTLASARATEHFLRERGLPTLSYHGDVPLDGRRQAIAQFAAEEAGPSGQHVLVCTDLAARGLDMPGRVDHVVNFDFPMNPIDYIHRTGRTARAGASGRITSIVTKRDATLAGRIERALTGNLPLDELSAAKSVLPPNMRPKPETLKRRADELKAARHSRRGTRGAARIVLGQEKAAASKQAAMPKGKRPAPAAGKGSSLFAFGKRTGPASSSVRKGPFAFSATVKSSSGASSSSSSSRSSSSSGPKSGGRSAAAGPSSTRWGREEQEEEGGSSGRKRQAFSSAAGSSKGTGGKRSVASSRTPASKGRRSSSAEHATRKQSLMRSYKK